MSIPMKVEQPRSSRSLAATLAIAFLVLSVVVLFIAGSSQIYLSIQAQQKSIADKQQLIAQDSANKVTSFVQEKFRLLEAAVKLTGLGSVSPEKQKEALGHLLSTDPAFHRLAFLDADGQELASAARLSQETLGKLGDRAESDLFDQVSQGNRYISSLYFDQTTPQPMVTMAVPVMDIFGNFRGTLMAELNLRLMWSLMSKLKIGNQGLAYVVDRQGNLIASRDVTRVMKRENVGHLREVSEFASSPGPVDENGTNISTGINGTTVVGTYVPLGTPDAAVVIELPVDEAYHDVIQSAAVSAGIMLVMAILAGLTGVYMARRLAVPLRNLTETAAQIADGELDLEATVKGPQEVIRLGEAFNSMTYQLRYLINGLEERVTDRTRRLEIVATLGEQLNAILDPNELLNEVVHQIKKHFDYYHTHIYLLDNAREKLVVTAGTGQAGQEMAATGYSISLQAPKSLVARAARSKTIVKADDVQDDLDWLPNPLLPDTCAEMAVPIVREGEIIGILDVQADRVAALDETDASLLRSLANQVAVALTNARLFEQTTRSKEEAESAKEKAEQARRDIEIANQNLAIQMWQTAGQAQLNERMRGEQDVSTLANNIIQQLCKYLDAQVGALYVLEDQTLGLAGTYAYHQPERLIQQFRLGQGLVGQAALEKQPLLIADVPGDHLPIMVGLGEIPPRHLLEAPFAYDDRVVGVIELGTLAEFSPVQAEFLQKALESIAVAFTTAQARRRVNELLEETQQQAEILQVQEQELRAANEELESQAESLRASEANLRAKQEELEQVNAELEEKAHALEENSGVLREQRAVLDRQNQELKVAQQELEQKAEELALASKYKSEFLANMSHELRTPLNSLLILAGMLAKNEEGNLTPEQMESVQIIHSGGTDLLHLINDILDLSKIEAGKVEFRYGPVSLGRLAETMQAQFGHVAESKGLKFEISVAADVPATIESDQQRVEQIVKNLLSNAFKFTHRGEVRLAIYRPERAGDGSRNGKGPGQEIAIRVSDTGIGMTPEQQQIVFEAFQQADTSTSRQYGGTGLGLSISRELVIRLGGRIELVSEKGKGSDFTLYLPLERPGVQEQKSTGHEAGEPESARPEKLASSQGEARVAKPGTDPHSGPAIHTKAQTPTSAGLPDDREEVQPGDRVLLVVEDDTRFARVVYDYAHQKNFKCLLAGDGPTGLDLVHRYPVDAIILDLNLPGMSGWEVLDALKDNPTTRHLPVHIMSASEADLNAYKHGAMGFLSKPIDQAGLEASFQKIENFLARQIKSLLLVEDDANLRNSVRKLLDGNDLTITEADLGQTALEQLAHRHFDCMILDLSLPDMSGFEVLNRLNADDTLSRCPVIVYTGKALTEEENLELLKYADSVIVKGVKSPERLLDETALFLHRIIANLPQEKQQTIKRLHDSEAVLAGKNILIVDDDARNAFALSRLLSSKEMKAYIAPSGEKALELLEQTKIDLVLMDIMMPGMDGYETTRRIRAQSKFHTLPVLALTAKAMKGDREKCIEAGANDYLSKPIVSDRLFSMLRVWLSRG